MVEALSAARPGFRGMASAIRAINVRGMATSSAGLSEIEKKMYERIIRATEQQDWKTVEQTKAFIKARFPKSPLIERIEKETARSAASASWAQEAPKESLYRRYGQKTEESSAKPEPTAQNLERSASDMLSKLNAAEKVLHNNKATLEEINQTEDMVWKLYQISKGLDALKGQESSLTKRLSDMWNAFRDKQRNYRSPAAGIGERNSLEAQLQQELSKLKNIGDYFKNPRAFKLEDIESMRDAAQRAYKLSKNLDTGLTTKIADFFGSKIGRTKELERTSDWLNVLYKGLRWGGIDTKKEYATMQLHKIFADKMSRDIIPLLPLLYNPQADVQYCEQF